MARYKPSHPNCKHFIRRGLILTLAAVIIPFSTLIAPGAALRDRYPEVEEEAPLLEPGKAIERELAGGQKHSYRVGLSQGQFAAVIVEQRGIDVLVRAFGVDGKLIAERDSEIRLNGRETADLVSETAGSYRVEIESKYKMFPAGSYEILLDGPREATDQDRLLKEARALHSEAFRLVGAGKYDQARSLLERSLEIRQRMTGANHSDAARSLMLMGNICYYKDERAKAEELYSQAAEIFRESVGPDNPLLATCLNNLASLYQMTGKLVQAEELHRTALQIRQNALPPDHPDVAQSLNNLANVYKSKGDFISAEPLYARALEINERILGPNHLNLASPLSNLAALYLELQDYEKAEGLFQRSLKIRQQELAPDHPEVAGVLNRLGLLYYAKGDYTQAGTYLEQALTIFQKKFGENHSQVAAVLGNLGRSYRAQNDYEKAESFHQRSLTIKESVLGFDHPETAETANNLAVLYMAKGDYARAAGFQSRAIAATEHNIGLNLASGSERQKLAYLAGIREQLNQAISLHVRYDPANPIACNLAVSTVLQRKGRVLDAMSDSFAALRRRASAQDQALFDKVNSVTTSLAALVLGGPEKMTPVDYQKRIKAFEEQRETLESEISRRSAGFYERPHQLALSEIQAAIPDDAALVEFAVYRPFYPRVIHGPSVAQRYVAYIITRKNEVRWTDLGEAKPIDDAVRVLGKALRDPRRKDFHSLARAVDDRIMRPIRNLTGESKHLLISPDGALNLIPFEALVDEQGKYLVERYSVSYLTSGRDLLRLRVARSSRSDPVVVAAPLFEGVEIARGARGVAHTRKRAPLSPTRQSVTGGQELSNVYFSSLAGTLEEARAIKLLFPETGVLTGARASESSLKQVDAPRILHIATHGFFLQDAADASPEGATEDKVRGTRAIKASVKVENPLLRSGLALAGANSNMGGGDDGILTALEASSLNLWGTRLVTLSACDTGVGEVRNGEGVYGLRRAFVLAGTETLVMSLWPISDYVTREMMSAYYRGLKQGQGRGEALRQVQLGMLKRKDRQHPFYWASFIQAGEWANIEGKR